LASGHKHIVSCRNTKAATDAKTPVLIKNEFDIVTSSEQIIDQEKHLRYAIIPGQEKQT